MNKPVNDYKCKCGNDRCSKKEKSCWLCGAEIINDIADDFEINDYLDLESFIESVIYEELTG